jgi:hypothetical protein
MSVNLNQVLTLTGATVDEQTMVDSTQSNILWGSRTRPWCLVSGFRLPSRTR